MERLIGNRRWGGLEYYARLCIKWILNIISRQSLLVLANWTVFASAFASG